jgi:tetratricopeptide (TPR) repeat protein
VLLVTSILLSVVFVLRDEVTQSLTDVGSSLGVIENPELVFARTEAESLRQDPNQGLAAIAAAYQRIFLIEPNDLEAQIALDEVVTVWRDSINTALAGGDLETANVRLQEAISVLGEDPELTVLSLRLQNRYRAERLLKSTQALLTSHGLSDLPSAAAAIQAYQEILRIAPQHLGAERGLTELSAHYIVLAKTAAENGEVNNAISLLERASAANNELRALDDVRKLISQAATAQAAINELLVQARRLRADNLFISPPGANAAELYQRVLATDPNNMVALQGLNEVAAQILNNVRSKLAQDNLDQAEELLGQASAAGLPAEPINELRLRIEGERTRKARVIVLLEKSQQLMADGYITAPINSNATALLRETLQLDPANAKALELLNKCAQRLADIAQEAYQYDLQVKAKEYLDLALTINPDVSAWIALREKWGDS